MSLLRKPGGKITSANALNSAIEEARQRWAEEMEANKMLGETKKIKQKDLDDETIARMLTYDLPVCTWTHWFGPRGQSTPYECSGVHQNLLDHGGLDPENCPVCQYAQEQGMNPKEGGAKPTWLQPLSLRDSTPEPTVCRFVVLEMGSPLWKSIGKICANQRNKDWLAFDILIKREEGKGEYTNYSADNPFADSPMTEEEEAWMETAAEEVQACITTLSEERLAELLGEGEAQDDPPPPPPKRTPLKRPGTGRKVGI